VLQGVEHEFDIKLCGLPKGKATIVRLKYRAKNPLGGMSVLDRAFFIQDGEVKAERSWDDWESGMQRLTSLLGRRDHSRTVGASIGLTVSGGR
jgi:hypothetical protein